MGGKPILGAPYDTPPLLWFNLIVRKTVKFGEELLHLLSVTRRQWCAHIVMTETTPPKIDQLVAEAKAELKRLGIDTEGNRPDQLLTMAREARIHPRAPRPKPE
jgi:hypothetical protein